MKRLSGWSIADYLVCLFAVSAFVLFNGFLTIRDVDARSNPYLIRGLISLFILAVITSIVSLYESYYENKTEIVSSTNVWSLIKDVSIFLVFSFAILQFCTYFYGAIDDLLTFVLILISLVIVVAVQGTKKQAIERGAGEKGRREATSRDILDFSSCGLSVGLLMTLLLYWISFGTLPTQSLIVLFAQVGSIIVFILVIVWAAYDVDSRSVPVAQRSSYRRESVFGPPVGKEPVFVPPVGTVATEREITPPEKRIIPGVSRALSRVRPFPEVEGEIIKVWRSGEFIGNRMRFKIKVQNESEFIVTDVMIYIISFPEESLNLVEEDDSVHFPKLEPKGLLSQTFDFLPTQDCVRGEIKAGITFVDRRGKVHTLSTKPFVIRSVCDLLLPHRVSPDDFEIKIRELECGELVLKIDEWTPEEMFEKALRIVDESNFFEVSNQIDERDGVVFAKISGFALGKYTNKEVGVEISITGPNGKKGASCTIQVSGEDEAMILPTIDDLRERLNAWLCPLCSSPLSLAHVENLRAGKVVECPFCNVTIGR